MNVGTQAQVHDAEDDQFGTYDFLRSVIDLFAGPKSGVGVGVWIGTPERVEITGHLPRVLRKGLSRADAWYEPRRRGHIAWAEAWAVWHLTADCRGPRLAIPSLAALVELVAERRSMGGKHAR